MKLTYLLIGLLIGGGLGFAATQFIHNQKSDTAKEKVLSSQSDWPWPDDLDAMKAAPQNHKVVYEDGNVRILAVILDGKKSEPIHTHKWKSVMWISKPIVPCQIKNYKKSADGKLVVSDSLTIKEMPTDIGQLLEAEGPTSITNLGSENGVAYRVEFKREFER